MKLIKTTFLIGLTFVFLGALEARATITKKSISEIDSDYDRSKAETGAEIDAVNSCKRSND